MVEKATPDYYLKYVTFHLYLLFKVQLRPRIWRVISSDGQSWTYSLWGIINDSRYDVYGIFMQGNLVFIIVLF